MLYFYIKRNKIIYFKKVIQKYYDQRKILKTKYMTKNRTFFPLKSVIEIYYILNLYLSGEMGSRHGRLI